MEGLKSKCCKVELDLRWFIDTEGGWKVQLPICSKCKKPITFGDIEIIKNEKEDQQYVDDVERRQW